MPSNRTQFWFRSSWLTMKWGEKQSGDIERPSDAIFPKRVLIFSPHPDDDVISMGGTLIRLVEQGHEVHVAYQTSGNIAVFDEDAIRFADFATELTGHSALTASGPRRWKGTSTNSSGTSGPAASIARKCSGSRC